MGKELIFHSTVTWTGNLGTGTSTTKAFSRDLVIECHGKPPIMGSTAPAFGGDPGRYDPEDLLVASLSSCHMLWYLYLAAEAGVVVTAYKDSARGTMALGRGGAGQFTEAVLAPEITVTAGSDAEKAASLHERAHEMCYVARSVNFPVRIEPIIHKEA